MVFTGTDTTPLHENWIHRRTALIQTTLGGAAQKWFQFYLKK